MRKLLKIIFLTILLHTSCGQRLQPPRQFYQNGNTEDNEDNIPEDVDEDDENNLNNTEQGMYLGSPCESTCNPKLLHVFCDPVTKHCECEKKYPVKLSPTTGCGKPKKLGEQCFYRQSCAFSDQHSSCVQVQHNAICQCIQGYHSVSLQRPSKKVFCAEDLELLTSDLSALAGVATGIAVLAGLICFVLRLFTHARSPRPRHYANANLAPPILFSSDTGIPLTLHGYNSATTATYYSQSRPSSRSSRSGALRSASRTSTTSMTTTTQRAGSRRPSLASVHSSGSSVKSYSTKRFEKEREQKEEREMQIRLVKMHTNSNNKPQPPTPSPQSTDELLPAVHRQVPLAIEEECASTSFQNDLLGPGTSKEFH